MDNQHQSIEEKQIDKPDQSSNPFEDMNRKDLINLIKRLIDELPEKQRSCIQLRDFEGKSYKEIAIVLDITEEQVKINIFRARQAIKKKYQGFDNYGL